MLMVAGLPMVLLNNLIFRFDQLLNVISVLIYPGTIEFTRIPFFPKSKDIDLVKPATADLDET